ncbi:hypothetical protein [Streptomyces sp. H27-D2]|nr:hypothetical protein [Streptomyces sp. H27-D2]MEC4017986.1 hypothetical protein [Streptomyces sp. H27-D2]
MTTVDHPLFFHSMIHSSWQAIAVLALRNTLLATAAALSCLRLWRGSVRS